MLRDTTPVDQKRHKTALEASIRPKYNPPSPPLASALGWGDPVPPLQSSPWVDSNAAIRPVTPSPILKRSVLGRIKELEAVPWTQGTQIKALSIDTKKTYSKQYHMAYK